MSRFQTALVGLMLLLTAGTARAAGADEVDRLVLRKATTHPIRYYFSLPRGYGQPPERKWPVLVALAGRSDDPFEATAQNYLHARGDLPFVLVVPCTFNNNNDDPTLGSARYREYYGDMPFPPQGQRWPWDEAGILAILDDLQKEYSVEPRIYLTGFSAGGILAYHFILTHPEKVAAAVTLCGNFWDLNYQEQRKPHSPETLALPVRIILGELDPLGYEASRPRSVQLKYFGVGLVLAATLGTLVWARTRQLLLSLALIVVLAGLTAAVLVLTTHNVGITAEAEQAEVLLRRLGYSNVELTVIPGMKHDPSPEPALERLRPYWVGK